VPAIITGISKGLVEQLVSLVSLFVAVWAAFHFSMSLREWLAGYVEIDEKALGIAAFVIIVILAVFLLHLLGKLITKTLDMAALGWANRLLGLVFAMLKAALVIGLLIFMLDPVIAKFNLVKPEILDASAIYTSLRDLSLKVFPYLKDLLANA
jgi:membrane protein required for colicin V production